LGIVKRQSIKYTILSVIGSLIGALSILYIYPLSLEDYGFSQAIYSFSVFLIPFLGFNSSSIVINNYEPDNNNPNKVLILGFSLAILFSGTFIVIYYLFLRQNIYLLQLFGLNPKVFKNNDIIIFGIGVCMLLISVLNNHSNNLRRAVVPNLLNNIGLKLFLPVLILAVFYKVIDKSFIPFGLFIFYFFVFIILVFYVKSLGGFPTRWSNISFDFLKDRKIIHYLFIAGFTGIASILATKIDIIAISGIKNLSDVGKYSLPYFMASLIEIPMGGIASISGPFIALHLKNNNFTELNILLQKASNSLFLAGVVIFVMLYAIFPDLALLSNKPEAFQNGLIIFAVIGIAKLIDMVTSLNTHAISYSKYYSYNLYFVSITALINLYFTFHLTRKYGIIGTSLSILISLFVFNLCKIILLKIKMNLNPFSKSTILIIGIFLFQMVLIHFLQFNFTPIANIILKGTIIGFTFLILLKFIKPNDDIDDLLFGKEGVLKNGLNIAKLKKMIGF
jgi:O-antigen/teichoic acid export membrane protein